MTETIPTFIILSQCIRDLSFENKVTLETQIEEQPELDIDIQTNSHRIDDQTYEVTLSICAETKDKPLFILELLYTGVCQIQNIATEHIPSILMVHVPTLLFPYVRQIVSDVTINAGFPPLLLQPVDFAALYQQQSQGNMMVGNA